MTTARAVRKRAPARAPRPAVVLTPAVGEVASGPCSGGASLERALRLGHRVATLQQTVQREMVYTGNGNYGVDTDDRERLYSREDVEEPQPSGLYASSWDEERNLRIWRPNVRLLPKNDVDSGFDLESLVREVETPFEVDPEFQPTIGILGKNDCKAFATLLMNLMAAQQAILPEETSFAPTQDLDLFYEEDLKLDVGDMMKQVFENMSELPEEEQPSCGEHAAVVVARDEGDLVTLEAHAGKPELRHPEFFIRDGVNSFRDYNDPEKRLGTRFQFERMLDQSEVDVRDQRTGLGHYKRNYAGMTGELNGTDFSPEDWAGGTLGVTNRPGYTIPQRWALDAIRRALADRRWKLQGRNENLPDLDLFKFLPAGIKRMKTLLRSDRPTEDLLAAVKEVATSRQAPSQQRSEATQQLYQTVAELELPIPNVESLRNALATVTDLLG